MKFRRKYINRMVELLLDYGYNYQCSCVGTHHCPCPRCKVTIKQSSKLIEKLYKSGIVDETMKVQKR